MKTNLLKIPLYWSFYYFGWPNVLPLNYTFSLTFKCNSRCRTCNIWRKKKVKELTFKEWQKIFTSLGKSPYWVTLSGGEPFLRKDLIETVVSLCQICQPKVITIPTNGLLTDLIEKSIRKLLRKCPQTSFIVNISLDGIGKKHDQIRGVAGGFSKTISTFRKLKKMKAKNLTLGIHSVISKENLDCFPQLTDYVLEKLKPDSFISEIAEERVELNTKGKNLAPGFKEYQKTILYLKKKLKQNKKKGWGRLIQALRFSYYDLAIKILRERRQLIPCYAGVASAQIAPNGDVWQCCVRASVMGDLKKNKFSFPKLWFSAKAQKIRKSIKDKNCFCPLANASYTNILMDPYSLTKVFLNFLNQ